MYVYAHVRWEELFSDYSAERNDERNSEQNLEKVTLNGVLLTETRNHLLHISNSAF